MDVKEIEEKWVKRWEESKIFEADPTEGKKKIFVTFPFPYMNGPLHIGHALTSARCDVYARFKRMQGYNVLFPWAWHLTGEPITGAAERVKRGDEDQIRIFREIDGVPEEDLKKFGDPAYIAKYYIKESKEAVKRIGHSVDWRREFHTTSLNPHFDKFIEWQYLSLRKKGYVIKGTHPVVWCPHDESPTGDHDRLRGEGVSPVEFTVLKFPFNGAYLPAATLRPETVFGVTNMWINPEAEHVRIRVGGEEWIVSREAAVKLKEQKKVRIIEEGIKGSQLIGKYCVNPVTKDKVLNLPATFVDPDNATGIVMSVPSHAPYDWVALRDLQVNPGLVEKYGISPEEVKSIKPISLIKIKKFGEHPAIEISEKMGIKDQNDPRLDEATEVIYKEEFYKGVLKENTGKYKGMKVSEVKKSLVADFEKDGIADKMFELADEVICRCGTKCLVKILKNQWFLKYSDEEWKKKVLEALADMEILPEEARANFEYTIGWLEDKACARKSGLGTKLPWDPEWIVETLSDSTVYMAFYTIQKHIRQYDIPAESLRPEVFDYIFLGEGDVKALAEKSGIKEDILDEMRSEFEYWMPVDLRNSAKELIPNHLTFYIFHHVALFPRDKWPRRIGVNGMINVEGEKMSKSLGNFITLKKALVEFGADATRATLLYSAEGLRDPDWRSKSALDIQGRLKAFYDVVSQLHGMEEMEERRIDVWLRSRVQKHVRKATVEYESLRFRSAFQAAFFDFFNDVRWYLRRDKPNKKVFAEVVDIWVRLISPVTPMICEEVWEKLGKEGYVSLAEWPKYDEGLISEEAELAEELIGKTLDDVDNILKVTDIKPKKIYIYTSPKWKLKVNKVIKEVGKPNMKEIMSKAMEDGELRAIGKEVSAYVSSLIKDISKVRVEEIDELAALRDARQFFEKEFGCPVEVYSADEEVYDPMGKRKQASPMKPAIYVE
jgi:leucyl-tRNA synthetase